MPGKTIIAATVLFLAAAGTASAQTEQVDARIGQGKPATAQASLVPGDGVLLQITLPDGRSQSFPQLGTELVPLSGKAGSPALLAQDLDRNGSEEIIIRGAVPQGSAVLVFRFEPALGEFVPVEFTDDRDRTAPFLVAHATMPVLIDPSGMIEAQFKAARQDGRMSYFVARYRWDGKGFTHTADN